MKTLAVFNNQGGVGKTSLIYHLAWMLVAHGHRVVAADLDPGASLTAMFLDDAQIEELWDEGVETVTVCAAVESLGRGGELRPVSLILQHEDLALLPGDLGLSSFEGMLAESWVKCHQGDPRSYRLVTSLARVLERAALDHGADFVLVDVGAGLGALNRAALLAADQLVIPVAADLFSIVGLRYLGPVLQQWRTDWHELSGAKPTEIEGAMPSGRLPVLGYVTMRGRVLGYNRRSKAYERLVRRIPAAYHTFVLGQQGESPASVEDDPQCLSVLKHYHSLMLLAQDARKPMFRLTPADGAMGSHLYAVRDAHRDFDRLARIIAERSEAATE